MLNAARKRFVPLYYRLRNAEPIWRYALNARARAAWKRERRTLASAEQFVVDALQRDGIAFADIDALFGTGVFARLAAYVRSLPPPLHAPDRKFYKVNLFPFEQNVIPHGANELVCFGEHPVIRAIAGQYLSVSPWYKECFLERTFVSQGKPAYSQRWHRDADDKRMLKVFVYFTAVDAASGALRYVRGSQWGGPYWRIFPQRFPFGTYPAQGEVEGRVDPSAIVEAAGKEGMLVFCDAAGLHCGGYCTERERVMATLNYTSHASVFRDRFV